MKNRLQVLVLGDSGVGKTSVAYAIKRALDAFDIDVIVRDNPYDDTPDEYTLNRSLEAIGDRGEHVVITTLQLNRPKMDSVKRESTVKFELTDEDILAIADPWTPLGS